LTAAARDGEYITLVGTKECSQLHWKQATDRFADFGRTFGNPDFVALAHAHHAGGARVETPEGLAPALDRAFQEGGVQLVAVPIDYSENKRVIVDELRKHARSIRSSGSPTAVTPFPPLCGLDRGTSGVRR
jgi:thiamine pyrophosphate-dependent acetolactate synthase large subunit-like protein